MSNFFQRFISALINKKPVQSYQSNFDNILVEMNTNCINMIELTNSLPPSEEKEKILKELNRQKSIIKKNKAQ